MNKKTLALLLAFMMMFSTITTVFANETATIGTDAEALKTIGVLQGDNSAGVTPEYLAKGTTRMQAAIMYLRLKGLEDEAMAFTGTTNFADANTMTWNAGKAIMAYLKANPQLGWVGADAGKFNPLEAITVNQYYKVMLEALGYKQGTDFEWANVMAFAASKGLVKLAGNTSFKNNDVAIATVEALKINTKADAKTLAAVLVDAGMVNKAAAIAAGLYEEKVEVTAAVDSATAIGNTVVEVVFDGDVAAAAAGNKANYSIEGLAINAAVVAGTDTVRLETAAQTAGKLYTLTVGGKNVQFTGIAKVSGAPAIVNAVSGDVEEVVISFDKNLDLASATNVANYTINGVQIAKAEVDGKDVTLTTVGLAARTQYTVKVANVKSIDGTLLKSASKSFYTRLDTAAPKVDNVAVETNQRLVVTFSEKVTKASAENIANYTIKTVTGDTELKVLSAVLKSTGTDKEKVVTLTTEAQTANKKYEISITNIADQTKAANAIKTAVEKTFYGAKEDTKAPVFATTEAISRDLIKVKFTDDSKLDEASVLDANNYTMKKGTTEYTVESVEKVSSKNGEFVALLNVEAMEAGSYSLEVSDITDEFGNSLEATKKYFTVDKDTFAASTVNALTIDNENTITITFTKALKEASAENIANYSIDGTIGAPVSAVYTDSTKTVVLTTNDLKANVDYDTTINGVEDLAGNVLNLKVENKKGTGWNESAPALEDAYSINKYVVAMAFDEAVKFEADATLTLRPEGAVDATNDVVLTAKVAANDDTVIEFSNYDASVLTDNVTYKVYSIVGTGGTGITDIAGAAFAVPADIANYEISGTSEAAEQAEVVNVAQLNGQAFELTMSKNVTGAATVTSTGTVATFDVTYKDNVVTLTKQGTKIAENAEYVIDLSALLVDEHGVAVLDEGDNTTFYAEYQDTEKPYIVNVSAKDRYTVEIEYSETLDKTADLSGTYSVKNADSDVSTAEMFNSAAVNAKDNKKVTITLKAATPLEGIYDYELVIKAANAKDAAGNISEEAVNDSFSFNGTDLAPIN